MKNEKTSIFRGIVKGTMILGGGQLFTMLIGIVRGKFVAIILGAYGMGLISLIQSCLNPFQLLFSFGLPTPAVRSISLEKGQDRLHTIVAFRRVLLCLALLGTATMLLSAEWLNKLTFGSEGQSSWFIGISLTLLFTILGIGECSILQGLRKLKLYAITSIIAPLTALIIGIPIYYIYGIQGIVPTLLITALFSWIAARIAVGQNLPTLPHQTWHNTIRLGRDMATLGGTMMVAGFIGAGCTYLLNTYIRSICMEDIGFYQAATSITLQCTTMIFASMATDYFPHLSSIIKEHTEARRLVQQEGEIVILVITPIILLLILFAPLIVRILLTNEFLCIVPLLRMFAVSFIARAYCFPQDYICVAKGEGRWYFWIEGIYTNVKTITLFIVGYAHFGLIGLGYAAIANAAIDIISSTLFNRIRYGITYDWRYVRLFTTCLALSLLSLAVMLHGHGWTEYAIISITCIAGCAYTVLELDKRIDLRGLIHSKLHKKES